MPFGIVGAICVSGLLYVLMSACLCLMQPAALLDREAPFSAAFAALISPESSRLQSLFLATSAKFVSFGALTGAHLLLHLYHDTEAGNLCNVKN